MPAKSLQPVRSKAAERVTLATPALRLELAPGIGGGITRFDWMCGTQRVPLFRAPEHARVADPTDLACFALLPFSNRIAHGRFPFDGRTVEVAANRADEPFPLHGSGWLRAWTIDAVGETRASISLVERGRPYAFYAAQHFELVDTALTVRVELENRGKATLPFGIGLHPFLPRTAQTLLLAPAAGVWQSGRDWLPTRHLRTPAAYGLGIAYPLPARVVNHAFTGWIGRARVLWPEQGLALDIDADADHYLLYTPEAKDWFCFEPVDHPINAANLPGGAVANGMTALAPGQRLERTFRFSADLFGALPVRRSRR
ncbi:MAG TPA: aldose 1-epimerase [Pararobbsia sp.]|nr:aldose 1-epimerase [Pararobbsia sp.]